MKIYALPTETPAPTVDWMNYDREKVEAQEAAHRREVTEHFRKQGYTGKNTGRRVSFSVADGSAEYLIIEGRTTFLVHLPYGDAYQFSSAAHMTKAGILAQAKLCEATRAIFARAG